MRLCSSTTASFEVMSKSLYSSSSRSVSRALKEGQAERAGVRAGFPFLSSLGILNRRRRAGGSDVCGLFPWAQWMRSVLVPWLGFWEETGTEAPSLLCGSHTQVSVFSVS